MWRRSRTWNSGQVFCPRAHANSPANKCFTVTLSCLLLTIMFVYKLQAACGRNDYFSLVLSLASLITASTKLPGTNSTSSTSRARRFQALFLGLAGLLELVGALGAPQSPRWARCGPGGAASAPSGPPQPGQRRAVTSSARPRPTRALRFIETLLALKLIIHHSLAIFEQGRSLFAWLKD